MKKNFVILFILQILLVMCFSLGACAQNPKEANKTQKNNVLNTDKKNNNIQNNKKMENSTALATFGAGCFWCVEAVFLELDGVEKVVSGYMGGEKPNPSYREVCSGNTGHAEVCQITYNPQKISFQDLLQAFWLSHDPTTLNQQGADIGTQYRSVVFYHSPEQKQLTEKYKKELDASGAFNKPIVTEISPKSTFYVAEDYHQNYYALNPEQSYCSYVIKPKVDKFKKVFKDKLKTK